MSEQYRNLGQYCRWVLSQPFGLLRPPRDALRMRTIAGEFAGDLSGRSSIIVMHRDGRYQTELVSVMGPGEFPPHRHPHLDSIEVLLAGDIEFLVDGRTVLRPIEDEGNSLFGAKVRVRKNAAHGGRVGDKGAVFLSVQRWDKAFEPSSVVVDWDGPEHVL